MNNNKTLFGNYNYSIRTSGEVTVVFIREKEVICKLKLFIVQNYNYFIKLIDFFLFVTKLKFIVDL